MIIRAFQLKPGDVFERGGRDYQVVSVSDKVIEYCNFTPPRGANRGWYGQIGRNSKERVILVNTTRPGGISGEL